MESLWTHSLYSFRSTPSAFWRKSAVSYCAKTHPLSETRIFPPSKRTAKSRNAKPRSLSASLMEVSASACLRFRQSRYSSCERSQSSGVSALCSSWNRLVRPFTKQLSRAAMGRFSRFHSRNLEAIIKVLLCPLPCPNLRDVAPADRAALRDLAVVLDACLRAEYILGLVKSDHADRKGFVSQLFRRDIIEPMLPAYIQLLRAAHRPDQHIPHRPVHRVQLCFQSLRMQVHPLPPPLVSALIKQRPHPTSPRFVPL